MSAWIACLRGFVESVEGDDHAGGRVDEVVHDARGLKNGRSEYICKLATILATPSIATSTANSHCSRSSGGVNLRRGGLDVDLGKRNRRLRGLGRRRTSFPGVESASIALRNRRLPPCRSRTPSWREFARVAGAIAEGLKVILFDFGEGPIPVRLRIALRKRLVELGFDLGKERGRLSQLRRSTASEGCRRGIPDLGTASPELRERRRRRLPRSRPRRRSLVPASPAARRAIRGGGRQRGSGSSAMANSGAAAEAMECADRGRPSLRGGHHGVVSIEQRRPG